MLLYRDKFHQLKFGSVRLKMSLVNFRINLYMMLVKLLPFEIKVPKTEITETEIKGKIRFQPNFASSFFAGF